MAKAQRLQSTEDTPERKWEVEQLFYLADDMTGREHENQTAFFEHGHWWIACHACGATWDVVDVSRNGNDELDLEQIEHGDESCPIL